MPNLSLEIYETPWSSVWHVSTSRDKICVTENRNTGVVQLNYKPLKCYTNTCPRPYIYIYSFNCLLVIVIYHTLYLQTQLTATAGLIQNYFEYAIMQKAL